MFDVSFWELCVIAIVALLVFGPERLPSAARTAGLWIGRARRFVTTVKQDIDRELHLQEIRDNIKQNDQNGLHQFLEETKQSASELNQSISSITQPSTLLGENKSTSLPSPTSAIDILRKS